MNYEAKEGDAAALYDLGIQPGLVVMQVSAEQKVTCPATNDLKSSERAM